MASVGFLYPGHSAEDDYPRLEALLGGAVRLPLVHTDIGEDAHRVDALLEMGSAGRLAAGVDELKERGAEAVVWACTSASFVFGWEGAHEQVRSCPPPPVCPPPVRRSPSPMPSRRSAPGGSRSPPPTPTTWPSASTPS